MRVSVSHHVPTKDHPEGYYTLTTIADDAWLKAHGVFITGNDWIMLPEDDDPNYYTELSEQEVKILLQGAFTKYDTLDAYIDGYYEKHYPLTGHYSDEGIPMRPQQKNPAEIARQRRLEREGQAKKPLDYKKILADRQRLTSKEDASMASLRARRGY